MKHIYLLWNDYEQTFVEMTDKDFNQYVNSDGFHVRRLGIIEGIIFKIEIGISVIIDILMGNAE